MNKATNTKEECMAYYNNKLKNCKISSDVINVMKEFDNDENVFWHNLGMRAKKCGRHINNFFDHTIRFSNGDTHTFYDKVEYICDGDDFVRCGQVKYLYRYVGVY